MADGSNIVRLPQQQQSQNEIFAPTYASELQGRVPPRREWLVDGVAMRKTVVLFAGAPKIGKSLLLQQLLTAGALGLPWLGRETVSTRSFGMFTEDAPDELHRRQSDINAYYDREPADLELNLSWDSRDDRDALLVGFERFSDRPTFTPLWHKLWGYVASEGIQLVGLDTAAAVFGGNENFRGQVTSFVRELVKQAVRMNGCILLTVHPAKGGSSPYSGSTAWLGSVRNAIGLQRPPEYNPETDEPRGVRVLRGLGSNYGAGVRAERLEFQDGVLVPGEPEAQNRSSRAPLNDIERQDLKYRLLQGLRRVLLNGAKIPADELANGSLPNRARRSGDPMINRVPLNDLYRAQQDLIDSGQIKRVGVAKRCLLRPAEGPYYVDEEPWLDLVTQPRTSASAPPP